LNNFVNIGTFCPQACCVYLQSNFITDDVTSKLIQVYLFSKYI